MKSSRLVRREIGERAESYHRRNSASPMSAKGTTMSTLRLAHFATRPRAIVNGFVERLDDLALELAQPAAHTIIPSPSRVFRDAD